MGFEIPPRATEGLSLTLVAVKVRFDECRWNYMDCNPEDPGSNPGGSICAGP